MPSIARKKHEVRRAELVPRLAVLATATGIVLTVSPAVTALSFTAPSRPALVAQPAGRPDRCVGDEMGEGETLRVLEFSDAWAEALLAWDGGLVDKILTRCRVAPELVGRNTEDAATGPALRARLLDSVLAADGKARAWDDALPKLLRAVQMVDALPEERGGCGHDWTDPEEPPTIVRTSVLPGRDGGDTRDVAAVGARLKSRRTSIEERNPQWDDDRVQQELDRIAEDEPAASAVPVGGVRVPRPPTIAHRRLVKPRRCLFRAVPGLPSRASTGCPGPSSTAAASIVTPAQQRSTSALSGRRSGSRRRGA